VITEKCGTGAGVWAHKKAKQTQCDACRNFWAEYQKQWRAKNVDKSKEMTKNWRVNNPEKVKKIKNTWNAQNRDKYKKSIKESRIKNPDLYSEIGRNKTRRRRALQKLQGVENYTTQQVLDLHGSLCHLCGVAIDLQAPKQCGKNNWEYGLNIDHVIPISKGGSDTLNNVRPAHAICNLRKGAKVA
jgi:5-methylcytosine-specific restriction endonuclease McrA